MSTKRPLKINVITFYFFIALAVTPLFGKLWVSRIFFLTFAAFSSVAIFVYSQKITIQRLIDDLEFVSSFCNGVDLGGLYGEPWDIKCRFNPLNGIFRKF